jgi:hypothetical protein
MSNRNGQAAADYALKLLGMYFIKDNRHGGFECGVVRHYLGGGYYLTDPLNWPAPEYGEPYDAEIHHLSEMRLLQLRRHGGNRWRTPPQAGGARAVPPDPAQARGVRRVGAVAAAARP